MEQRETLIGIAEIAVALAGFASLVSVLGARGDARARAVASHRLRIMLEVALRNAGLALAPLPLADLLPEPTLWRVASALYVIALLLYGVLLLRPTRTVSGGVMGDGWLRPVTLGLIAASALACLANVLGLGGAHAFSLFLASLLLGLVSAGLFFLSVASAAFDDPR